METLPLTILSLKENAAKPALLTGIGQEERTEAIYEGIEIAPIIHINEKDFSFWGDSFYPITVPVEQIIRFFMFKGVPNLKKDLPTYCLIKAGKQSFYVDKVAQTIAEY